jgi:hypothetical protein
MSNYNRPVSLFPGVVMCFLFITWWGFLLTYLGMEDAAARGTARYSLWHPWPSRRDAIRIIPLGPKVQGGAWDS